MNKIIHMTNNNKYFFFYKKPLQLVGMVSIDKVHCFNYYYTFVENITVKQLIKRTIYIYNILI